MTNSLSQNELMHFGIPGMKWGRRKRDTVQEKSIDHKKLTPKQKKIIIGSTIAVGIGIAVVGAVLLRPVVLKNLETKKVSELLLSDIKNSPKLADFLASGKKSIDGKILDDIELPKGINFHRVAGNLETSINKPKYANYLKEDVLKYKGTFNKNGTAKYKTIFEALDKTKIAGETTMADMATKLATRDSKINGRLRSEVIGSYRHQYNYDFMKEKFKNASTSELAQTWVNLHSGKSWDSPVAKEFIAALKKAGYSGFTDTNDTFGELAGHAVVLINDSLVKTTGQLMSATERAAALKMLNNF